MWVDHVAHMQGDLTAGGRILLRQIFKEIILMCLDWTCLLQDTEP
jgi:hypothetical protein